MRLIDYPKNETADVIFLTYTSDDDIFKMTQSAISSLRHSEQNNKFRVILVESYKDFDVVNYDADVKIIYEETEFSMNRALNNAFKHLESDWVYVSNNDVVFCENWYSILRYYTDIFDLDSASPRSPYDQRGIADSAQKMISNYPEHSVIVGNEVIVHFSGWGWLMKTSLLKTLLPFPEDLKFWFQDNHLSLQLKELGKKHGCVTSSNVIHFGQQSYRLIPQDKLHEMTQGIYGDFIKKWMHLKPN